MKINYFFPIFKGDDIKSYLGNFKKSEFFKKNSSANFIFVCESSDEKNLNSLKLEIKNSKLNKLITLDKPFTYNDAFELSVKYFNADVVLLGDTKVNRIDLVFEKCLDKYNKNISVVHIVKKQTKFKNFIFNIFRTIYNFFIRIFTDKTDRLNVISLGLIDKNIIEILKTLPTKCCFLKNTKNLLGFETRTIYIPPKTETYKLNFKKRTGAKVTSIISGVLTIIFITALILLNCFIKSERVIYNIIGIILIVLSLCTAVTVFPKHIFDIRNYGNREINYEVKEVK